MWDIKGDIVTLSRRFSSRMKTRETLWSIENNTTRGPTATRNHGKTQLMTPRQKNTRITFWMNISAWKGSRVSTAGKNKTSLKIPGDRWALWRVLVFTFVHVFGEAVEDPCRGRGVKELHGTAEDLVEQQVMQL